MSNEKFIVFISWSKSLAKKIGLELLDVLNNIFEDKNSEVEFFLSSSSENGIEAGKNFHLVLNEKLSNSDFGILILTKHNFNMPWLMFEAGALSKNKDSHVIPYLINREEKRIESPISSLQRYIFSKDNFIELVKMIQKLLLKRNNPNLSKEEYNNLVEIKEKLALNKWEKFNQTIDTIIESHVEETDELDSMAIIMDENAYDYVVSKREEHLKELVGKLDSDTTIKRIIIFGGIATFLTLDTTTNAFARWLAKDHEPKLYICHETLNALLDRADELDLSLVSDDIEKAKKATDKIKKINNMKKDLLNKVGQQFKERLIFVELETMPSNFIAIEGTTIYLTPALHKRSSDTFTFKLSEEAKLNYQLLDYIISKIGKDKDSDKKLLEEIDIIKKEIKGEKNEK